MIIFFHFFSIETIREKLGENFSSINKAKLYLFFISLVIRLIFGTFQNLDYWGDSYSHYLISLNILQSGNYYDFKQNHLFWLPGYHYFSAMLLYFSWKPSIFILHIFNSILASISVILVFEIIFRMTDNRKVAILGAGILALNPTHILYSNLNMPEISAGLILLLMIRGWVCQSEKQVIVGWIIGLFWRYELWFLGLLIIIGIIGSKSTEIKKSTIILCSLFSFLLFILLWSTWIHSQTGNYFYWLSAQFNTINWDNQFYGPLTIWDKIRLYLSLSYLLPLIGCLIFIFHKQKFDANKINDFLKSIILIITIRIVMVLLTSAIPISETRFILLDLHLFVLLTSGFALLRKPNTKFVKNYKLFNKIEWNNPKLQITTITLLVILLTGNSVYYLDTYRNRDFVMKPEYEAGIFLKDELKNGYTGKILVDSSPILYFSGLEYNEIITTEYIDRSDPLSVFHNGNQYICLMNVSFSLFYEIYGFLKNNPDSITFDNLYFEKIFHFDGWELQYGAKPVVIYRVIEL